MTQTPNALSINDKPVVLLAEDDPDQSDMLSEALQDEGYCVDAAFSGDTALKKLFQHDYAVVLMDIRMPGLDGITVLKKYRKEKAGRQSPVLVVSAFATDSELKQYQQVGADGGFSKPYDLNVLLAAVARLARPSEQV